MNRIEKEMLGTACFVIALLVYIVIVGNAIWDWIVIPFWNKFVE